MGKWGVFVEGGWGLRKKSKTLDLNSCKHHVNGTFPGLINIHIFKKMAANFKFLLPLKAQK